MLQHETKQTEVILESMTIRRRLTIGGVAKLICDKLAALFQLPIPLGPDDVHIQIGKTQIKVRVIKSPYGKRHRRTLALATAQYLVRSLTAGMLSQLENDLIRPTCDVDPSKTDECLIVGTPYLRSGFTH